MSVIINGRPVDVDTSTFRATLKEASQTEGFGDWMPIVEARRVIENGKTVRMQIAIRGEEGRTPRDVEAGRTLVLELPVTRVFDRDEAAYKWDVIPVVK